MLSCEETRPSFTDTSKDRPRKLDWTRYYLIVKASNHILINCPNNKYGIKRL